MKTAVAAWLGAGILVLSAESPAAPPPASAFAALPEMSMVRLSPNGQRVAWANDPGGTPLAHRRRNDRRGTALMEHPDRELVCGASLERLHLEKPGTVIMSTYNFSGTAYRSEMGSRISGGRKDSGWERALLEVEIKSGKGHMIESGSPYTDEWILDAGRQIRYFT
jgi:hypothetical protein